MRLKACAVLAAALCFTCESLASEIATATVTAAPSTGSRLNDLIASTTPFPDKPNLEYVDRPRTSHIQTNIFLRLRQNLGQDPDPGALKAPNQVPPVTVYSIYTQVGDTAKIGIYTYTQKFENVPDQFPSPKPGQIGLGNHKRKREAAPTPVVNTGIAGRIAWR